MNTPNPDHILFYLDKKTSFTNEFNLRVKYYWIQDESLICYYIEYCQGDIFCTLVEVSNKNYELVFRSEMEVEREIFAYCSIKQRYIYVLGGFNVNHFDSIER